jgi:hypothetical protein
MLPLQTFNSLNTSLRVTIREPPDQAVSQAPEVKSFGPIGKRAGKDATHRPHPQGEVIGSIFTGAHLHITAV